MDNPYGALTAFYIPKSFLERKLKIFVLVKDETKPTAHSMPDEVCGFTDVMDETLRKILYSAGHEREIMNVNYFPASPAFEAMKNTNTRLEISCHPLEGTLDLPQPG
jgi:hypothetical protein